MSGSVLRIAYKACYQWTTNQSNGNCKTKIDDQDMLRKEVYAYLQLTMNHLMNRCITNLQETQREISNACGLFMTTMLIVVIRNED